MPETSSWKKYATLKLTDYDEVETNRSKNLIGIATQHFIGSFKNYFPDIAVVDFRKQKIQDYKLIIFSGGEDINPEIYKESNRYSYYNKERDIIEVDVLSKALRAKTKILGVCRGHQLINAVLGGKLYQDLARDAKVIHDSFHELKIADIKGGKEFLEPFQNSGVNSLHHQGVRIVGNNLTATSQHKGIIESTFGRNILTVQFHPEFGIHGSKEFFGLVNDWIHTEDKTPEKPSNFVRFGDLEIDLIYERGR